MWSLLEAMRQEVVMFGCGSATGPSSFPPGAVGPRSLETSVHWTQPRDWSGKECPIRVGLLGPLSIVSIQLWIHHCADIIPQLSQPKHAFQIAAQRSLL